MTNNILKASVSIEGTRPLFWNSFNVELLDAKVKRSGIKGNDPNEWKKTVLITENNQLYLLPQSIFSCIREGGKYTKNGRSSMQTTVTATLQVLDNIILVDRYLPKENELTKDKNEDVYLDIRSVKNPSTRGRNIRYRVAAKYGWKVEFKIAWDCTLISKELIEAIIIDAGNYCGLGDGRNIGMGRFTVKEFKIVEDNKDAKTTTA
ncbi:hypothetical protein [Clostridium sp. ZS2-4]|uniref:hypothetical protein n=1 Tax=Clostridium sp. ZS2-4 TaxID=2987703 RepID=UPI00227AB3B3|nr:hypothetical protein [Clostridium sp. ZS2-4]MCY6354345.1 hypothetical protein [Clostridium sp. ZS2-4]